MLVAAIKRMIPLSLKAKLKSMLVTPGPPVREKGSSNAKLRPCASGWPRSVCECDMHLGAFKQARIHSKLLKLLEGAGVEYVNEIEGSAAHIAVDIASLPLVQEILDKNGFKYEIKKCRTSVNDYDFPPKKNGTPFASLVSVECYEIRVQPLYFCSARRQDANAMSVLISTFNDVDGARLFHSHLVRTRTYAIESLDEAVVEIEASKARTLSQEPIDVVVTTVDGSDPAWREKFNAILSMRSGEPSLAKTANAARYTSHDELRFVLRSINYYAPYIRKIFIVTDGQRPAWLDVDHPRIALVDHREIIDPEYLPNFNSDAIESCLWKIPGLSERFIYFNDDMFLMALTTESTFYTPHGLPRFYASPRRIPEIPADWADSYTMHAHLQSAAALKKRGYERPTIKYRHAPYVARKSVLQAMEAEFAEELSQTRNSRTRSETSFATISFLYPNYALAIGRGVLSQIEYQYIDISLVDWKERLLKACRRTDITFACVNESHDALDDESLDATLRGILTSRFPCVAPWERDSFCLHAGAR